jgi:hypothetical protein
LWSDSRFLNDAYSVVIYYFHMRNFFPSMALVVMLSLLPACLLVQAQGKMNEGFPQKLVCSLNEDIIDV